MPTKNRELNDRKNHRIHRIHTIHLNRVGDPITLAMSKTSNANTNGAENNSAKTNGKVQAVEHTKTPEEIAQERIATLERIANEKKSDLDTAMLYEKIAKDGLMPPNDEVVNLALKARRELASGMLSGFKARELLRQAYDAAREQGYDPQAARSIVEFLVVRDGKRLLNERTVRNALPQEAKDPRKNRGATGDQSQAPRPKTPEELEGMKEMIIPPAAAQGIAKYAEKGLGCIVVYKNNHFVKIKPAVIVQDATGKKVK